jgi:hypothetical protein
MDYTASDWIENTGAVPAGVGPDTRVEVVSRHGGVAEGLFRYFRNPRIWIVGGWQTDIIRFRFLETPAERDARIARVGADLLDAGSIAAEQAGRDGE